MKPASLWLETTSPPHYPSLQGRVDVDVAVVGAGITGLTTAYLLNKAGCRVAVLDQRQIAHGETGHTTAHVTCVTDARLHELVSRLGEDAARGLWEAGRLAMEQIQHLTGELEIDCELRQVPAYLFASVHQDADKERDLLRKDAEIAARFGFAAELVERDPLFGRPGVRFSNQLKFHPLRYVQALARAAHDEGVAIFEKTCGSGIDSGTHEIRTDSGVIHYDALVAATHVPIQGERGILGATLLQTKLASYSTYAIEAEVDPVPESLFWDTNDPYLHLRFDHRDGICSLIIGGEDHKTGQDDATSARYSKLEKVLREKFPSARPRRRWSGQVVETPDGLPFIGGVGERQFVATGFSGNGMTLGTFSAMLIRDLVTGQSNPWAELFDPARKRAAGAWNYLRENKDFPAYFVKDRLARAGSPDEIAKGAGAVVKMDGKKCAVYRDETGNQIVLSPVCPHMGCIVAWNDAEKTWDCPCHGSRFSAEGALMAGPAESNLARM